MADTNHLHATPPVEGDGVNYQGIAWFVVILVGTVVFCQVFVWGLFVFTENRLVQSEVARTPLAAAPAEPSIQNGQLHPGSDSVTGPVLLVDEPMGLKQFRADQDERLRTYGWVNQGAEVVRLPIDRAKTLVLERGLPSRAPADAPAAPVEAVAPTAVPPAPAAPAAAAH